MAGTKTSNNPFKEMNYDLKKSIFLSYFSSGAMTTESFEDKIELYKLICFLTLQMKNKDPLKYKSSLDVLEKIYNREIDKTSDANGLDNYLIGLSIVCDDLLYGIYSIQKPENFKNGNEIVDKIKNLIEQWMPF